MCRLGGHGKKRLVDQLRSNFIIWASTGSYRDIAHWCTLVCTSSQHQANVLLENELLNPHRTSKMESKNDQKVAAQINHLLREANGTSLKTMQVTASYNFDKEDDAYKKWNIRIISSSLWYGLH
jgi:hypothetical protein